MAPGTIQRWLTAAFAAILLIAGLGLTAVRAQNADLTFLHINDLYEISASADGQGGFAGLKTLLDRERARAAHSFTTLGGDFLSPSLLSGTLQGAQMIELLNAIGVDLAVFGNHEFDFGPQVAAVRRAESNFPWLGTNMIGTDGQPFGGSVATVLREAGGVRIGFFGVLTPETAVLSSPGAAIRFEPPAVAAAAAVASLKKAGAQVVIALTHLDFEQDRALVRAVKGIDLVLGGHDHDPIAMVENGTLILKSGHDAHYLGVVDLAVRTRDLAGTPITTVRLVGWRLIANREIEPDAAIAARAAAYQSQFDAQMNRPLATVTTVLDSRRDAVRTGEAAIGDLITDALRTSLDTDVALINGGGIRGDRLLPAGTTLTRKDILTELPFGNTAVVIALSGADLLAALENGVSQIEAKAGRFPQVSGLRFSYDRRGEPGRRVTAATVAGRPVEPTSIYRIATTDYLLAGGDGYQAIGRGQVVIDPSGARLITTLVMTVLEAAGTVAPVVEQRILALP